MPSLTAPSMTIGGAPAATQRAFDVVNPATGEPFAQAPECSQQQLDAAFAAAQAAQAQWGGDEHQRRALMLDAAAAIAAAGDELVELLVLETGKPTELAAIEIPASQAWLEYYSELDMPRVPIADDATGRIELRHRPLGVVAAITPWNFPVGSAVWKIAPSLRAGNTIVLKPSPFTPLAVLRLGEILGAILPAGVVNIVSGGDDLGAAMSRHPVPRKVTFTGSIGAGKQVNAAAAPDLKRVTLELGGNDAAILLDDVDLATAVPALLTSALFNCGQVCAIPKRVYAPERLYGDAVDAFARAANAITLGSQMGPLSTKPQFDRVSELVADAIGGGATAVTGGAPDDRGGYFFPPTILADARDDQRIVAEEQFGPALPILPYREVDEAVQRANSTMYGLCGSVWGGDAERATAVAEQLECGVTYVNAHGVLLPHLPFGGAKWSGLGVENGLDGLLEHTERQVVFRAGSPSA